MNEETIDEGLTAPETTPEAPAEQEATPLSDEEVDRLAYARLVSRYGPSVFGQTPAETDPVNQALGLVEQIGANRELLNDLLADEPDEVRTVARQLWQGITDPRQKANPATVEAVAELAIGRATRLKKGQSAPQGRGPIAAGGTSAKAFADPAIQSELERARRAFPELSIEDLQKSGVA